MAHFRILLAVPSLCGVRALKTTSSQLIAKVASSSALSSYSSEGSPQPLPWTPLPPPKVLSVSAWPSDAPPLPEWEATFNPASHAFGSYANWLIQGKLMVGRYPGVESSRCTSPLCAEEHLSALVGKAGVVTWVSFQQEVPSQNLALSSSDTNPDTALVVPQQLVAPATAARHNASLLPEVAAVTRGLPSYKATEGEEEEEEEREEREDGAAEAPTETAEELNKEDGGTEEGSAGDKDGTSHVGHGDPSQTEAAAELATPAPAVLATEAQPNPLSLEAVAVSVEQPTTATTSPPPQVPVAQLSQALQAPQSWTRVFAEEWVPGVPNAFFEGGRSGDFGAYGPTAARLAHDLHKPPPRFVHFPITDLTAPSLPELRVMVDTIVKLMVRHALSSSKPPPASSKPVKSASLPATSTHAGGGGGTTAAAAATAAAAPAPYLIKDASVHEAISGGESSAEATFAPAAAPAADDDAAAAAAAAADPGVPEAVYLHCWGGKGRSGTVAAAVLATLYPHVSEAQVLARLKDAFLTRGLPGDTPETDDQRKVLSEFIAERRLAAVAA